MIQIGSVGANISGDLNLISEANFSSCYVAILCSFNVANYLNISNISPLFFYNESYSTFFGDK